MSGYKAESKDGQMFNKLLLTVFLNNVPQPKLGKTLNTLSSILYDIKRLGESQDIFVCKEHNQKSNWIAVIFWPCMKNIFTRGNHYISSETLPENIVCDGHDGCGRLC